MVDGCNVSKFKQATLFGRLRLVCVTNYDSQPLAAWPPNCAFSFGFRVRIYSIDTFYLPLYLVIFRDEQ